MKIVINNDEITKTEINIRLQKKLRQCYEERDCVLYAMSFSSTNPWISNLIHFFS